MIIPTKVYEKPDSNIYHGVLADIVDLGLVTTTYKGVSQTIPAVRFVWILDANGKDGKPFQVNQRFNISNFHEKSNIYKTMKQILGAPPDVKKDIDIVLGVTRRLVIQRDQSADGTKDFANITGILPPEAGKTVPVPAGFVRDKDKPVAEQAKNRNQAQPQQKPQQQTPQQTTATAPVVQGESLEAQVARLTAQLNAKKQGADVNFGAPSAVNSDF